MTDRGALEDQLATALGKAHQQILNEVMGLLGDPPDKNKITASTWEDIANKYRPLIVPILIEIYLAGVQEQLDELGGGVDLAEWTTKASEWAGVRAAELINGINETSRKALDKAIEDYYTFTLTMKNLRDRLNAIWSAIRAATIAITEVTMALIRGGKDFTNWIQRQGATLKPVIQTAQDDRVCPICAPKDGKNPEYEGYPPYHVRCRCQVAYSPIPA